MTDKASGFVYCLSHVVWSRIGGTGAVKIGMTAHDPAKRLSQITASSGLLAPGRVEFCLWVSDRRRVEKATHDLLCHRRVRSRRELFRCTPDEARAAIERAAADMVSQPWRVERPVRLTARRGPWQPPRRPWRRCSVFRWRRGDARALALCVLALAAVAMLGLY